MKAQYIKGEKRELQLTQEDLLEEHSKVSILRQSKGEFSVLKKTYMASKLVVPRLLQGDPRMIDRSM